MSHPVNDEILENLYEEIYEELSESYPDYSEETLDKMATSLTQQRFEDLCQWTNQKKKHTQSFGECVMLLTM